MASSSRRCRKPHDNVNPQTARALTAERTRPRKLLHQQMKLQDTPPSLSAQELLVLGSPLTSLLGELHARKDRGLNRIELQHLGIALPLDGAVRELRKRFKLTINERSELAVNDEGREVPARRYWLAPDGLENARRLLGLPPAPRQVPDSPALHALKRAYGWMRHER